VGSDGVRIVRAAPGDREEVLALVERLLGELEDRPEEFVGLDRARTLRELEGAGEGFAAFLARAPGRETVGVVTVVETFAIYAGGRYGVIDEMYVAPEYRSAGVGRRLIEAAPEGTIVRLCESGYADTPSGRRRMLDCTAGWGEAPALLKFWVEHGLTYEPGGRR
jgi:GNAT superfamily N-acetyltransferase